MKIVLKIFFLSSMIITLCFSQSEKPNCEKPIHPKRFLTNNDVLQYNSSMEQYQTCMLNFIQKHKEIISHENMIVNSAIQEWNDFVQQSNQQRIGSSSEQDNSWSSGQVQSHTTGSSNTNILYKNFKF